jgi:tRNA threonylcarbamoyladenosine biosynthesis protein TsaB
MRFLLVDTCGAAGSVAFADVDADPVICAAESLPGRSSSERLIPVVRSLMTKQGWRLTDLSAIVVVSGPGSFTGVRVGLSAAKGFSEASRVPLIAVSRLAVLAWVGAGDQKARVHVALDAGRGEFYYGKYVGGECVIEALMTQAEVEQAVGAEAVIVCEESVATRLSGLAVRMLSEPHAEDALGIARWRAEAVLFNDAAVIDANYLRRTDEQLFARPVAR